ncbi:MAG: xanthine dehydrogenase family protein molybdopterin-binding subunit [Hyphomicrobiales bacterium]|nr:xanthine dehydrogenase family protein molybdopterin-binding subunit [Hyphomicrobiales bacterium]
MARARGRGVAAVNYPTGMNLGGDPSQALVHATTTGTFVVTLSSVDLGQGLRTVMTQICAEAIGVPPEMVLIDTADTDTGPHCMGTFASRGTHRIGNAIIMAANEARAVLMDVAAEELEVNASDLETDGKGAIQVKAAPSRSISVIETALAAHFKHGRTISGRGMFMQTRSYPEPETGRMVPATCYAHACTVAEVEVDTETGEVEVISLNSAYEVGRALNPKMVEQQIIGGAWMGLSHALYETTEPYYPNRDHGPVDFNEYLMPGPGDLPEFGGVILERPAGDGPYGAKGVGEMTANSPIPAIANAIFDAVGVRVDTLPITPEKVLRGILAKDDPILEPAE